MQPKPSLSSALRLAEVMAALSLATDLGMGQPLEFALTSCVLATRLGESLGMPPTGKAVRVTGVNVARFADGKIVESWFNFDMLTLLQQLGAIPTPEHADA